MGGGAFIWLKGAQIGPKTANHAEIGLAIFVKTLSIVQPEEANPAPGSARNPRELYLRRF
jgi:hypothetical protein